VTGWYASRCLEVRKKDPVTTFQDNLFDSAHMVERVLENGTVLRLLLETAVARLQRREQARWRRALSLLLTVVLSAVVGAASFAVFLWLYYQGVISLG